YLCLRLADRAKIGETIEFSPYGGEETYRVKVVGYNRSIMTESVTMTDKCADALGIGYCVSAVYTNRDSSEIPSSELISGKQDKRQLMDSFGSFVQIMDSMVFILVVAAVILGLPAGLGTLQWMIAALAGEYEMKLMPGPLTYTVSILLTFGTSLLVGWMVARKNGKIDMVEALKNAE
ncbi:MAG: ABC transporter permease, partial [Clostridia bacterium]|nr:ABC transporter permease [Clostridia bacterium]